MTIQTAKKDEVYHLFTGKDGKIHIESDGKEAVINGFLSIKPGKPLSVNVNRILDDGRLGPAETLVSSTVTKVN